MLKWRLIKTTEITLTATKEMAGSMAWSISLNKIFENIGRLVQWYYHEVPPVNEICYLFNFFCDSAVVCELY